jgi:hypothetical protein
MLPGNPACPTPCALTSDPTCSAILGSFCAALGRPDFELLLVLADACLDAGDEPAADCLRWAALGRKRPFPFPGQLWFRRILKWERLDPESDIPCELWRCLRGGEPLPRDYFVTYLSATAAFVALAAAWRAAFAAGWRPEPFPADPAHR